MGGMGSMASHAGRLAPGIAGVGETVTQLSQWVH